MWSFASHAGTGLAVAGLSATYYALARKNAQLERENRIDHDGDQNRIHNTLSALTASQMLLKKELDNLSRDSGHLIGLNGMESLPDKEQVMTTLSRPSYFKINSGMEISSMISRAQTNFSNTTVIHNSQKKDEAQYNSSQESLLLSPEEEEMLNPDNLPLSSGESSPRTSRVSENSRDSTNTELCKTLVVEQQKKYGGHQSPLDENLSTSPDCFPVERTKSPLLYYKNPDFGKRNAGRHLLQFSETYISPGFDIKKEIYDFGDVAQEESKEYKESTRFLFPPALSDSKVSVCDDEQQLGVGKDEVLEIFGCNNEQNVPSINQEEFLAAIGHSQMDEIRDYNLQIHINHELRRPDKDNNDLPLEGKTPSSFPIANHTELLNEVMDLSDPLPEEIGDEGRNSTKVHSEELKQRLPLNYQFGHGDTNASKEEYEALTTLDLMPPQESENDENEERKYPELCEAPSTSVIGRVPDSSWISWPIRWYLEFGTDRPQAWVVFLGVVVLLIGLLGKFFITMGDWFEFSNEDNPYALMEH